MIEHLKSSNRRKDRRRLQWEALESRTLLAATARRLADLNALGGSDPEDFVEVGSITFFTANDGTNGRELWKSDGTEAGTILVKDINLGASSSDAVLLTNVNGTLFFVANDGTNGRELWKSNGTEAGTVLIEDIFPGATGSFPGGLTNVSGTLFFSANDGTTGTELWKSTGPAFDSTTTGLVEDINPGAPPSFPGDLTNVSGTLFFSANNGTNEFELWKSTGGAAADATTTSLVEDINPGAASSTPRYLTNVSGMLFFSANDGTNGRELWKSTGGAAADATTTSIVDNIRPGAADSDPGNLTNVSGTLFFVANDGTHGEELWKSQGTALNTEIVADINPDGADSGRSGRTNVSGTLYFEANDGTHDFELWKSDGTLDGTKLVRDINLGSAESDPNFLANINGALYFQADDGTGAEAWIVSPQDGTDRDNFVRNLYHDVLAREPEAAGLAHWLTQLDNGVSTRDVAAGIWESIEHRGIQVDGFYHTFFDRDPDAPGRQFWIDKILGGMSEESVMAAFVTTDEYLLNHALDTSFVVALYQDLLSRDPDADGQAHWTTALGTHALTPAQVAQALIDSHERHLRLVDSTYQDYLDRQPDLGGRSFWTSQLDLKLLDDAGVIEALLATPEYFNKPPP